MQIDYQKLMTSKSDEGLQEYLDKCSTYLPEAVEAAIIEMQKRGRAFSDEELTTFRQNSEVSRKRNEDFLRSGNKRIGNNWKKNIVEDKNAPAFYSERAIYTFSAFFSVIFGAILLAINFHNAESKKGVWEVVAFGVIFTGLQFWVLSMIPRDTMLTLVCSMIGGILMNQFFWKKYIGKDTKYRTKPIWKPLIIGIIITIIILVPLILAIIYDGAENLTTRNS